MKNKCIIIFFALAIALVQASTQEESGNDSKPFSSRGYAYIYNLTDQTVNPGQAIAFDSNGAMSLNINHAPGGTDIILKDTGIYSINFITQGLYATSFVLFVNGLPVPGGSYEPIPDMMDKVGKEFGQLIINTKAGDVLSLRNYSPTNVHGTVYLKAAGKPGKPLSVNASIVIQQIG